MLITNLPVIKREDIVGSNIVAIYLENPGAEEGIVAPIAFEYKKEESVKLRDLAYDAQLDGALAGKAAV
jgi:hypothetical protein